MNDLELQSGETTCSRCKGALDATDRYCRNCGMEVPREGAAIEAYLARTLPERIDDLLSDKIKDKNIVEIEISARIADRAMQWLKMFGFFFRNPHSNDSCYIIIPGNQNI
jgi:hypothetical protein